MRHNGEEVLMNKGRMVWVIALIALLAAACGAGTEGGTDDPTTSAPDNTPTTLEPVAGAVQPADPVDDAEKDPGAPLVEQPDPKIPRAMEPFVTEAVADLAARLDVDEATITVVLAEPVVWPDGAIGCPQPGVDYIQVQVEGSRTVLTHGQISYFYHGGGSQPGPFLCEQLG